MKRWIVPGIPFAVSLSLSLAAVGSYPYWQDSGLYLMAVKDLGVLYPPGFGLYLVLCKAWTLALFFVDFTLAVHLFSSLCAALAAGTLAVAVRDLLRSKGKLFKVLEEDPGDLAGACGILAGVLLACGYTFWATAIYAKGYSLYYLVLTLLLWRMIRADESGRPRDFTFVAVLIGLAWQCHPSATLTGLALAAFVALHAKTLGPKAVAGRVLVAAGCALGPSLLLLPILMARDPWLQMGHPVGAKEFLDYVAGRRFLAISGVFGLDADRVASFGLYLWEEMLGVGLGLVAAGLVFLATSNRRLLAGMLLWLVPYAVVTILFKIEGQHDCWFVASWLPLFLVAGVGACRLARKAGTRGKAALAAAGLVAAGWAVAANHSDVSQRRYDLAELYGRTILEPVDPDAILVLSGDDPNALPGYLQRVKGVRPDVALITASTLFSRSSAATDWYDDVVLRRHPFLRKPDYDAVARIFPQADRRDVAIAAFLNANADSGRPMFTDHPLPPPMIRRDRVLIPAGVLWKLVPIAAASTLDLRYWKFPVEPENVRSRIRRERGQMVVYGPQSVDVKPQAYERRLFTLLVRGRLSLAAAWFERKAFEPAAMVLESVAAVHEESRKNPQLLHMLGCSYFVLGKFDRAEPLLRRSAETAALPEWKATALFYLGEIALKRGDGEAARKLMDAALAVPGLNPAYRREMESRRTPK